MAEKTRMPNLTLENVRIGFRNFSGKEGRFNAAGDRNFTIFLDEDTAKAMENDGWNIKWLPPREEGDDLRPILKVKVSYNPKARPPRVVLITSRGRNNIGEDEINILDWADIRNVDLILNPYEWEVSGRTGITAYLQSIYVSIEEDALERKYADLEDSAQNTVGFGQDPDDNPPWS